MKLQGEAADPADHLHTTHHNIVFFHIIHTVERFKETIRVHFLSS